MRLITILERYTPRPVSTDWHVGVVLAVVVVGVLGLAVGPAVTGISPAGWHQTAGPLSTADSSTNTAAETPTGEPNSSSVTATRELENATLAPGESTVVSIELEADGSTDPAVYESFDPPVADIEIRTKEPSATATGTDTDSEGLFAVWNSTETAVLEYEVTVPVDAEPGETFTIGGEADTGSDTVEIDGPDEILVGAGTNPNVTTAERTIEQSTLPPGGSTDVTVELETDTVASPAIFETVSPEAASVELVDDSSALVSRVSSETRALFGVWNETNDPTLQYELTIPENATPGETVAIDGQADVRNDSIDIEGHQAVTVEGPSTSPHYGVSINDRWTSERVEQGETARISVTVENVGDEGGGEQPISLDWGTDGHSDDTETIALDRGEQQNITLSYDVPAAAPPETVPVEVRSDNSTDTARITVEAQLDAEITTAEREIERSTLEPGNSTIVTLEMHTDELADPALYETFDPEFEAVELVEETPTPVMGRVSEDRQLATVWKQTDGAVIDYEVTVPEDATPGDTFMIDGEADVGEEHVTIDGPDEINVETDASIVSTTRSVEESTARPGESTVVTVDVEANGSIDPAVYEAFEPGFEDVELIETEPSATVSGTSADGKRLFAVWNGTDTATLQYEGTVPESPTEIDQITLTGNVTTTNQSEPINRTNINVGSTPEITTADRHVESNTLEPGETTNIRVDLTATETDDFAVYENFNTSFADVTLVDTEPSPALTAVAADNTGVVALWPETTTATLEYELTAPTDTATGETFAIYGSVDGHGETSSIGGPSEITTTAAENGSADRRSADSDSLPNDDDTVGFGVIGTIMAFLVATLFFHLYYPKLTGCRSHGETDPESPTEHRSLDRSRSDCQRSLGYTIKRNINHNNFK